MTTDFIFEFYNEGTEVTTIKSFKVSGTGHLKDMFLNFTSTKHFDNFCSKLEEDYGIHDISYDPDIHIHGYHSYEIHPDNYNIVINSWKYFISENGFTCGNVVTRTVGIKITDEESSLKRFHEEKMKAYAKKYKEKLAIYASKNIVNGGTKCYYQN
tara:strand:- start:779 stop:1246 length:468 start_codon:yes stop_codon:yes gene_type:complete